MLLGGIFSTLQPNDSATTTAGNRIARVNADGTLDTTFDPKANNSVNTIAVQADGRVLLGGTFTALQPNGAFAATARVGLARLNNDPATQSLGVPSADRIQWLRGGTSPEVQQVTFEQSTDGGAVYTTLGSAVRITGGWELTSLNLPASGSIRARARATGGYFSGSSGLLETIVSFGITGNPDSDNDDLPDAWEIAYFGSIVAHAALDDADNDGLVNFLEYAFGLNPARGDSQTLPPARITGPVFAVSFTQPAGVSGVTCGAEWSTTLLPGSWTTIPDTGTGNIHTFSVPIGSDPRKFIRLTATAQ